MSALKIIIPSYSYVQNEVKRRFGIHPCSFQVKSAITQLKQKDCITITLTGSGKTLTFWIPLLFNDNSMSQSQLGL
ncbi:hypothetical protein BDZ94DRAFT_1377112 [Collybia nuda]|uniref:DEAD/DEAH box helicase domain-containing protein n=1 Tax=Collybia nuda TaxID=64659 RepID=A0A9P5Y196_9AGAR|nr:hypothetical protein BDZ94DRAFT_1377112 [Collybia nuda]